MLQTYHTLFQLFPIGFDIFLKTAILKLVAAFDNLEGLTIYQLQYAGPWIAKSRPIPDLEFVNSRPLEHKHSDTLLNKKMYICKLSIHNRIETDIYSWAFLESSWSWFTPRLFFSSKEPSSSPSFLAFFVILEPYNILDTSICCSDEVRL